MPGLVIFPPVQTIVLSFMFAPELTESRSVKYNVSIVKIQRNEKACESTGKSTSRATVGPQGAHHRRGRTRPERITSTGALLGGARGHRPEGDPPPPRQPRTPEQQMTDA